MQKRAPAGDDTPAKRKKPRVDARRWLTQIARLDGGPAKPAEPHALQRLATPLVRRQLGPRGAPAYLDAAVVSPYSGRVLEVVQLLEDRPVAAPWLRLLAQVRVRNGRPASSRYRGGTCALVDGPLPPAPAGMALAYTHFEPWQLAQVNAMLTAEFWPGINVEADLQYPEFSAVACYRKLVVGCAFASPDGYVTYLHVRPGWRRVGIARRLLYLVIRNATSPTVALHVSANNNAMVLYQAFGFKPEEFIVDFYEKYLPHDSTACKNALFVRLRRGG